MPDEPIFLNMLESSIHFSFSIYTGIFDILRVFLAEHFDESLAILPFLWVEHEHHLENFLGFHA